MSLGLAVWLASSSPASAEPAALAALDAARGGTLAAGTLFDASRPAAAADPHDPELPPALLAPEPPPFIVPVPSPDPARPALRRLRPGPRTMGYDALIREHARRHGLDARFVKAVIAGESEFSKKATSRAGARGLMQLMPATAAELGVAADALYRPAENIRAGTAYLAWLFARAWKKYHLKGVDYRKAPPWLLQRILAAYNAGPRFLARRRLYRQTRAYVAKVLLYYRSAVTELVPAPPKGRRWIG